MDNFVHVPVMLNECLDGLNVKNVGIYFDGTLGGGGHSYEILKRSAPNGKLFATDLDTYAINKASERLKEFNGRFTIINDNFKNFAKYCREYSPEGFDGILLDLGVSSFQLDDKSRGFSYLSPNEKLDMRMDGNSGLTAKKILNEYPESEIKRILKDYGEERFASQIAKNVVLFRKKQPIEYIGQLNKIIEDSIPQKFKKDGHPSKRTFQALRIEVNGELEGLYQTVLDLVRALKPNGRIAILTFHSLEDRIVKRAFKELETDCICDKSLPICVCGKKKEVKIVNSHPIIASDDEINKNSRSKCAKLRIAEKI